MDFGRIVLSVKPYSPDLPISCSAGTVPTVAIPGEVRRATYGLSQHDQLTDLPRPLQTMNFILGKKYPAISISI